MEECPLNCINVACRDPDWLEQHKSFLLTLVGFIGTGFGMLLNYFLRSRCTNISCWGLSCVRKPVDLSKSQIEIVKQ